MTGRPHSKETINAYFFAMFVKTTKVCERTGRMSRLNAIGSAPAGWANITKPTNMRFFMEPREPETPIDLTPCRRLGDWPMKIPRSGVAGGGKRGVVPTFLDWRRDAAITACGETPQPRRSHAARVAFCVSLRDVAMCSKGFQGRSADLLPELAAGWFAR